MYKKTYRTLENNWLLSGTWGKSWGCPEQGQELDFNDPCESFPIQDILWFHFLTENICKCKMILQSQAAHNR